MQQVLAGVCCCVTGAPWLLEKEVQGSHLPCISVNTTHLTGRLVRWAGHTAWVLQVSSVTVSLCKRAGELSCWFGG